MNSVAIAIAKTAAGLKKGHVFSHFNEDNGHLHCVGPGSESHITFKRPASAKTFTVFNEAHTTTFPCAYAAAEAFVKGLNLAANVLTEEGKGGYRKVIHRPNGTAHRCAVKN
jgi:hypothetical protein